MTTSHPYTATIIGLGRIASILEDDPLRMKPCTHMGAFSHLKRIKVVAGCDIDPVRRKMFGERWKISGLYDNHRALLKKEKPAIISICTWTDSHHAIVLDAVKYPSVKAIICEKPIAMSSALGRHMVKACAKAGKLLVINHERRFEDRYIAVKDWLENGLIGEVRTIIGHVLTSVPHKQKSFDINGTSLLHDGTHLIDIIHFLVGRTTRVSGFINDHRKEAVTAVMELESGIKAFIEAGGYRKYFDFELDIQGSQGRILIGNTIFKLFKSVKSHHYTGFRDLQEYDIPAFSKSNYFINEMNSVVSALDKGSKKIASSGYDGLETLRVIEAIFASIRKKGVPIPIRAF